MHRSIKSMKRRASSSIRSFTHRFKNHRECPICGWQGYAFAKGGAANKLRYDCVCPRCHSYERHRLAFMIAEKLADLDFSAVLHVAPERELETYIKSKSERYLSIDISNKAMAKMDITSLELPDNSQSLIWISHVLEHVKDDSAAIAEMHRVLRPSGKAFVQVPIWRTVTYEDLEIKNPSDRINHFYQADHVRLYGLDIVDRFASIGFESSIHRAQDFGPELLLRHGLSFASTNEAFVFRKAGERHITSG